MSNLQDKERIAECARELGSFVGNWAIEMMFRAHKGIHPDRLIGNAEATEFLDVSQRTLDRYREDKLIEGIKVGTRWKYRQADLESFKRTLPSN